MYSTKEDALSPDELRKRLYQTFKNKGVLDTLKVRSASNTAVGPSCSAQGEFGLNCCFPLLNRFRHNWGINLSRNWNTHLCQEENQSPNQYLWNLNLSWSQPVTAWWLITWAPQDMSTASLYSTLKVAYAKKRWARLLHLFNSLRPWIVKNIVADENVWSVVFFGRSSQEKTSCIFSK